MKTVSFFYEGAGRREAVDAIRQAVSDGVRLMTITGQSGSGRTAVLRHYLVGSRQEDGVSVVLVTGHILLGQSQCLDAIRQAFCEAAPETTAALMNSAGVLPDAELLVEFSRIRDSGRLPVVLLDDAHEIQQEVLASLVDLCRSGGVTLVLAGDDSLVTRTGEGPLIPLRALEPDECSDFVSQWAEETGQSGNVPGGRHLGRIHHASGGMPGNILMELQAGTGASRRDFRIGGVPVGHVLFVALAVGGLSWWLIGAMSRHSLPGRERAIAVEVPLALPGVSGVTLPGDSPVVRKPSSGAAVPQQIDVIPRTPPPPITLEVPVEDVPLAPPASLKEQGAPAVRFSADEEALMQARPSRHTLQLCASFNEQTVRNFVARHAALSGRVFRTTRDALPWFVVVAGDFRGKDDARAVISRLPVDVQHLKPWPRTFQGIQDELRRRQD